LKQYIFSLLQLYPQILVKVAKSHSPLQIYFMIKTTLFCIAIFCSSLLFSQGGTVIISSSEGNIFVFVKGIKQNTIAETNVEINNILDSSLIFKALIADSNIDSISGNVKVIPGHVVTYKMTKTLGKWSFTIIDNYEIGELLDRPASTTIPLGGTVESTSTSNTKPNNTGITAPSNIK